MSYHFNTLQELKTLIDENNFSISKACILREVSLKNEDEAIVIKRMSTSLTVMKENAHHGIITSTPSTGGLIGTNAKKMNQYISTTQTLSGNFLSLAIQYALAITEENARMNKIVACPTAGACGVVPSVLIAAQNKFNFTDEQLVNALFNASAIGILIAVGATLSGAQGGCQAEVGSACAMSASALVELMGGSPNMCFHAAAMALKNTMGLVCDPVAGLVEVPCSKRNVMGAATAISCADMALAGIQSVIPLDEVIIAMKKVGLAMPYTLKETAKGGVAKTKTGQQIKNHLAHSQE